MKLNDIIDSVISDYCANRRERIEAILYKAIFDSIDENAVVENIIYSALTNLDEMVAEALLQELE